MFVGKSVSSEQDEIIAYETVWDDEIVTFLSDHRVRDIPVVPGTGFLVMATECLKNILNVKSESLTLTNISFQSFLMLDESIHDKTIRFEYNKLDQTFTILSFDIKKGKNIHVTMKVSTSICTNMHMPEYFEQAQHIPCGLELYETLANKYRNEFAVLEYVKKANNLLYTDLKYKNTPERIELRKTAVLDVSSHVGISVMPLSDRMKGLYAESMGECIFHPAFFTANTNVLDNVHVKTTVFEDGASDFRIFAGGVCLAEMLQWKGGVMEQQNHSLYHDEWVIAADDGERVALSSYENVFDTHGLDAASFHSRLVEQVNTREKMMVLSRFENEITSYLRAVRAEYPTWDIMHVIVSDKTDIKKLSVPVAEREITVKDGKIFVRRLASLKLPPALKGIKFDSRGSINNMKFVYATPTKKKLEDREVEVLVQSTGLNFRDVLNILGMYPGDPGFPGGDFAGIVTRIGSDVKHFNVGDNVFGMAEGSLRTYAYTAEHLIKKRPDYWSIQQASAITTLATTVHEALINLSKIQAGQTILVHAGAGGIGLTAIQYAKHIGCNVITTCGSPEKRMFLEKMGITKITSSRDSKTFDADMTAWGDTVDVVLNSLSDDFIPLSAKFLKSDGHFCEIGKRAIWSKEQMKQAFPSINYHVIAIDHMAFDHPQQFNKLFDDIISMKVEPLNCTEFTFDKLHDAFEYLRDAKNIGKVVITQQTQLYSSTGVYIITGGLGYVGQHIAQTLYDHGARNIVLLSSSTDKLPTNWDRNFKPRVIKCDVGSKQDLGLVFSTYGNNIRGIFHAAGVLSDKTIPNLTPLDWDIVYKSKVTGARNISECLHELKIEPDFVVLCSSIASAFGAAGQANYAAGNGALDQLARTHDRFISIQWGAWVGGGMAVDETMKRSARMGVLGLDYKDAIQQFNNIVMSGSVKVAVVSPLDTSKLPDIPMFSSIRRSSTQQTTNELDSLRSIPTMEGKKERVIQLLSQICSDLGIDDIHEDTPWRECGLDSLSMVEFKNIFESKFRGIPVSDTLLLDYPNMGQLAVFVTNNVEKIKHVSRTNTVKVAEPVAVVGISCRMPGSCNNPVQFFDFLMNKKNAMVDIDRFNLDEHPTIYSKKTSMIDDPFLFDNKKFRISDAEALMMDPQQRILLECVDEAFMYCDTIDKKECGVFVGVCGSDYAFMTAENEENVFKATGAAHSIVANRVSYTLGLEGPSMAIDTACSSSLVALDAAFNSINNGECAAAVVGGVQLNLTFHNYANFCTTKMLSENGRCATFSDKADGYARGEGCGVVLLKQMKQAIKDGDNIYAIIRGTSVNQDGRSANLTSPNGPSQERCIQHALDRSNLTVDEIDFIEAHGTGTPLGDPQEIQSISNVFEKRSDKLPIGALKSNIGHLEGAAGIAGVIKTIMCLQKQTLPPNINFTKPNPRIVPYLKKNIFLPVDGPCKLKEGKNEYNAGVSSFGFGGTNSHVIISYKVK